MRRQARQASPRCFGASVSNRAKVAVVGQIGKALPGLLALSVMAAAIGVPSSAVAQSVAKQGDAASLVAGQSTARLANAAPTLATQTSAASQAAADAPAAQPASTLQQLIDEAVPGSQLVLPAGIYEGELVIAKELHVAGAETILRYTGEATALRIEADRASVSGLTILDETVKSEPTVLVAGNGVRLEGLEITTASGGIWVRDAEGGELRDNVIDWSRQPEAQRVRPAAKGNGIDLYGAHSHLIVGNTLRELHDGIYLENSDDNEVSNNRIYDSRYGVHCMYTIGTRIYDNVGEGNITGAMVMNTQDVEMIGNHFSKQSENVNSQGLLLFDAQRTLIRDNLLSGNRVGMYIEQSSDNVIEANRVLDNFTGLHFIAASGNRVSGNELRGNVADAQARESTDNEITGNYWDEHRGIDADGDGYSDISYAINPLYAGIAQRRPPFQLFYQSPGMRFLEGLYQADMKSWTTDVSPLMKPPSAAEGDAEAASRWPAGVAGALLLGGAWSVILFARRR